MNRTPPILHPFVFGAMFVLMCFHEIQPFTNWQELMGLMTLTLGVIYLVLRGFRYFFPEGFKAAILTTLCVILFCFFGFVEAWIRRWLGFLPWTELGRSRYVFILLAVMFGTAVWLVVRTERKLRRLKIYLNIATTLAFAFTVFQIITHPLPLTSRRHAPRDPNEQKPLIVPTNSPDIYYILLDAYTSSESLQAYWGYDNSEFINFLTNHGFQVVKNARGNYDSTPRCMSASLNMNYSRPALPGINDYAEQNRLWEIINRARVPLKLEEAGYEVINLSLFDLVDHPQFYEFPQMDYTSLTELIVKKSVAGFVQNYFLRRGLKDVNRRVLAALHDVAAASGATPQPRFIYAHLEMPHPPFFYDRHGRPLNTGFGRELNKDDYLEQLIYVNQLATNLVSNILSKSKRPPIIVLQGDHGFRSLPGTNRTSEAMTILNAYHLPGAQPDWVYEGITPVNSFRMIFNHYFGTHYTYHPDVQIFDNQRPPGRAPKD